MSQLKSEDRGSKAHKFLNKKMFSNENFNAFKEVNESKVYLSQKAC